MSIPYYSRMSTPYYGHQFIPFKYDNNVVGPNFLCTQCGVLIDESGFLHIRAEDILRDYIFDVFLTKMEVKNIHISYFTCAKYKEKSECYIGELKQLGHKWKLDRPSVFLQCEVCDVEYWLDNGKWIEIIPSEIRYKAFKANLRSCDEVIMDKVLK